LVTDKSIGTDKFQIEELIMQIIKKRHKSDGESDSIQEMDNRFMSGGIR